MTRQSILLIITSLMAFIACFGLLYAVLKPAAEDGLLQVGSQSAYNAPAVKTKLEPMNSSLSELLEAYHPYKIISTNKTSTGLIVILEEIKTGLDTSQRNNVLCMLTLPNPKKGQYEATSRCWQLSESY